MTEEEEAYEWLRQPHLVTDRIPDYWKWYVVQLLKDLDKRLTTIEEKCNVY